MRYTNYQFFTFELHIQPPLITFYTNNGAFLLRTKYNKLCQ